MTDRKPDDLFDALRDRLGDYGQEPPAPLWASIRAQLPPPVAAPQLRRRRRWSPVLLLGLLMTVVGAGWQWWHTRGASQRTSHPAIIGGAAHTPIIANQTEKNRLTPADHPTHLKAGRQPMANTSGAAQNSPDGTSPTLGENEAAVASSVPALPEASHGKDHSGRVGLLGITAGAGISRVDYPHYAGHSNARAIAITSEAKAATKPISAPSIRAADSRLAQSEISPAPTTTEGKAASVKASMAAAETCIQTMPTPPALVANPDSDNLIAPRVVALALLAAAGPVVRPTADTVPYSSQPLVRRWAVLVLAGPALTHRQLGAAEMPAALPLAPGSLSPAGMDLSRADMLAQQERPSAGFGVQLLVRRALSGRWSLSTGLGYQEYAGQLTIAGSAATRFTPTPTPEYTHRDTYRFLTVPIRLGYALGSGESRLRFGLLAGAEAALYLGGSTLAPDGSVSNWGRSNNPYRALSVALSTGLEARYRLAPRLELVAQPTATYFLSSLTRSTTGQNARYLWGAGALFGVSFDLR